MYYGHMMLCISGCGEYGCLSQCSFDGRPENVCNCPKGPRIPTGEYIFCFSIYIAYLYLHKTCILACFVVTVLFYWPLDRYLINYVYVRHSIYSLYEIQYVINRKPLGYTKFFSSNSFKFHLN